jgi:hypothetical protein
MTGTCTGSNLKALAIRYIEAVGQKKLDEAASFLHPRLEFDGNFSPVPLRGPEGWIAALRRLSPVLERNEVRKVLVEGNEACILYDFVTSVCHVPSAEWLVVDGDKIRSIYLLFDRSRWPEVLQALPRP